jgi:hypothetical protein
MADPLPLSRCPWCDYLMDAATNLQDAEAVPAPGDVSVCLSCASVLVFNDDLTLRGFTPAEIAALPSDIKSQLERYQRAIREIDRR